MLSRSDLSNTTWWSVSQDELFKKISGGGEGITDAEARKRQTILGLNEIAKKKKRHIVIQFLSYFLNPLILLLIAVAVASYVLDNVISTFIISAMVLISVCMAFYQEYTARDAADKLRKMIQNTATVLRNGTYKEVPLRYLVPGDVVRLSAGDLVPADCRILSCKDFFVNQASLTGESLPVEKNEKVVAPAASVTERTNVAFFGSNVISGSAEAIIVQTGDFTQFGELAGRLSQTSVETAFDRGIKEYSMLMIKFVVILVFSIFVINAFLKNNIIEALLFALAVAVGLTPEMLPAMVTANLSKGANNMSKKGVIVKRLPSIQNLGAMDVLCTDKTGTLTEDKIRLVRHVDIDGEEKETILHFAYLNSFYQTGLRNPLDIAVLIHDAVLGAEKVDEFKKVDEIPFDFVRRRMSVVVEDHVGVRLLLTKGAPESIISACVAVSREGKSKKITEQDRKKMKVLYDQLSKEGYRVLALASRLVQNDNRVYGVQHEKELTFEGFLAFLDPPKKTATKSLNELMERGIEIKILSGDNELVNTKIANEVGLKIKGVALGSELDSMGDDSLRILVEKTTIFARVSPVQKERIILALQHNKHVVGYMGDGINDSLALKTSDVGISVDSAVDVAKESADIILLRKSLHVLYEGVDEGRTTFANIMKYLRMGSSSNFGNMFSVVGGSIFLPFLPMAPLQIILNNFLYDMSQMAITTDSVDKEYLLKPAKWSIDGIKNFMVFVGPVSSIFDYITFGLLLFVFQAPKEMFHAGWFIESLATQTLVIHVIRTNKVPFIESWPSKKMLATSLLIVFVGIFILVSPLHTYFGFEELPGQFWPILFVMVIAYLLLTQFVKMQLLKRGIIE